MKRYVLLIMLLITVACGAGAAHASTTFLEFDDSLDLSGVTGFQFDVIGADINKLTLTLFYQNQSVSIGDRFKNGALPNAIWDVFKVRKPAGGVAGFDQTFGSFTLSPGIVLSLQGEAQFSLDNFVIMEGWGDKKSEDSFKVQTSELQYGTLYTLQSVPVPSTVLLLSTGVIGLLSVGRRRLQQD